MCKFIGLWIVVVVCVLVIGYTAYLVVANASRESELSLYPWQGGEVAAVWVLVAAVIAGMLLVPAVRLLARKVRQIRAERKKRAAAPE